jgi:hypothetical protein
MLWLVRSALRLSLRLSALAVLACGRSSGVSGAPSDDASPTCPTYPNGVVESQPCSLPSTVVCSAGPSCSGDTGMTCTCVAGAWQCSCPASGPPPCDWSLQCCASNPAQECDAAVGQPCTYDKQCAYDICLHDPIFPGGYCTMDAYMGGAAICSDPTAHYLCPPGSTCATIPDDSGAPSSSWELCLANCVSDVSDAGASDVSGA